MKRILAVFALVVITTAARGQLSFLPGDTYAIDVATSPAGIVRFYLDTTETTPAPVGTPLWFVVDLSGNGISTVGGQVTDAQVQDIFNGTGDDRLFFTDIIDGVLAFAQPGRYEGTISVPLSYETFNLGVMLWNDANLDSTIGNVGDTFGYHSFGIVPSIPFGNPEVLISANIHADQTLVTPVPEPAQIGVVLGALSLLGALIGRTVRRKQNSD